MAAYLDLMVEMGQCAGIEAWLGLGSAGGDWRGDYAC